MTERQTAFAVTAISVGIALAVYASTHWLPPTGDEPHYLILADSLVSDFDVDLQNNYERDAKTWRIYGPIQPHMRRHAWGWMPYHTPGLSALLAIPFAIGGTPGARVALCLLAGLLPWSLVTWLRRDMPATTAAWLTFGLTISFPFSFGAQQIYPDLVAGVLSLALCLWLLRDNGGSTQRLAWAGFWLASGLLPWLNVKYAATTVVFAAGGLGAARRARRAGQTERARAALTSAWLVALGPLLMAAFNVWAYESILGGRRSDELTRSPMRALMMFLGLHLDQGQGMFVQQPLLLLGVAGLPLTARSRPRFTLFWAALYASLIVPNSFELSRWGGYSPDGRFGWSAAWLWAIPLGFLVARYHERLKGWIWCAIVAGVAYQAALAVRWLPDPEVVFPRLQEALDARESFFPVAVRHLLPSYYLWDFRRFLTYPPNLAATLGVLLVLAAGAFTALRPSAMPRPGADREGGR